MKERLDFLRGSVRPMVTYELVGALIVLTFLRPVDMMETFKTIVALAVGYWYGSRGKTTP